MPKRKILYLVTKATAGGAQKYVYDLATALPKSRFESFVAYGTAGKLVQDLATAGIAVRNVPSLGRNIAILSDIKSFFEMRRTIKDVKPDVLHLNSSKAAGVGAFAARLCGVPNIVFTVHGWPFKEERGGGARALIYVASWVTAFLSHAVIVVSKTDEQLARRMWGIGKKVSYIPLGISELQIVPPEVGYRAMFGSIQPAKIGSSTLRLVTIGELTANKGIRYGIEAVAVLAERGIDAVYVIAGEGEEGGRLKALAQRLGVDDRVFFPGFVEHAAQNLSGFDVLVLPSVKEGTPYVLLEAARAGVSVVATDVVDEDLTAHIPNMRTVPSKDVAALADAIAALAKAPRARDTRADTSSLSEMVERTIALYR